jgi:hypothetical protein
MNCAKEKKQFKIKSKSKNKNAIEEKLNHLYPNKFLNKDELEYDLDIQSEYRKHLHIQNNIVNLQRIANLPTLQINNLDDIEDDESQDKEIICENDSDIELDTLEKETIGNKTYYLDYIKGIIYNLELDIIGHIDELGEINIG